MFPGTPLITNMSRYQRHIFICTNKREPGHPKGCCSEKGSEDLRRIFKQQLKERGLSLQVRANVSGCLDACEFGPTVVVYPEGIWYGGVRPEDVPEIIDQHIIGGRVIERLLIRDSRYTAPANRFSPLILK